MSFKHSSRPEYTKWLDISRRNSDRVSVINSDFVFKQNISKSFVFNFQNHKFKIRLSLDHLL